MMLYILKMDDIIIFETVFIYTYRTIYFWKKHTYNINHIILRLENAKHTNYLRVIFHKLYCDIRSIFPLY